MIHDILRREGIDGTVEYHSGGWKVDGRPIPQPLVDEALAAETARAAIDFEDQAARDLGKWLERRERNDRALADPDTPERLKPALHRLNARCDTEIARLEF